MPGKEIVFSRPLKVRPACHTRVCFDVDSPQHAELFVEYLCDGQLLARERRPVGAAARGLDIKTHPEASHIACSLRREGSPISSVQFKVDCGRSIEPAKRHFIIIGAMKAGTTTLFQLLSKHPQLCGTWASVPKMSSPKEINYFQRLYQKGDSPLHYDWRFPFDPERHAWTLDASPNYAKWPGSKGVPARIASLGAQIKLAYIMREPVDRIESHLAHSLRRHGDNKNIEHCIRTSQYAMQLDKYMVHFKRDDILLLNFEQLKQDPAATQRQIFDFLGIEHIVASGDIHNTRGIDFQLDEARRAEYARAVRNDVKRLINLYDFKPAESWLRDDSGR